MGDSELAIAEDFFWTGLVIPRPMLGILEIYFRSQINNEHLMTPVNMPLVSQNTQVSALLHLDMLSLSAEHLLCQRTNIGTHDHDRRVRPCISLAIPLA